MVGVSLVALQGAPVASDRTLSAEDRTATDQTLVPLVTITTVAPDVEEEPRPS